MNNSNTPSKGVPISAAPLSEIFSLLSSQEKGLTKDEVVKKQKIYGKNILPEKKKNWIKMLLLEFTSPLVIILLVAVGISLAVPFIENGHIEGHDLVEPIAILVILLFNALLGFFQELKAENTLQALKTLQPEECTVMRNGKIEKILGENLVVGDIVILSEGEKIPADIRLLESVQCSVDESLLTGESLSVSKSVEGSGNGSLSDIKNTLFSGSQLLSGRAKGIVTGIGISTEIGKIAHLLSQIISPPTPLEKKLDLLGKRIGIGVIAVCVLVFLLSFLKDFPLIDSLLISVALAVGAVPEGLPAVMTISLALGVAVMARKNMLVRELKSVETLGSITTIASDKTGTITQNKMSVEEIFTENTFFTRENFSDIPHTQFFDILRNCNDAQIPDIGDPTEIGLLQVALDHNAKEYERISEVPFSSASKWMSTSHRIEGEEIEFIKGAPEVVSNFCSPSEKNSILKASNQMAEHGIRTIAVATRKKGENAIFVGIAGLQDPPRDGVKKAILDAKKAGIKTIMITGDHAITAKAIAKKVGISGEVIQGYEIEKMSNEDLQTALEKISIFARVSPEHKVRICKALQSNRKIVAMTGDGVNDAPAISQAQVGISMGKVGTSVARSASDIVLIDDDFSTIVRGIEEGRRIFSNIKKSVVFLLSTNFAEVLVLLIALLIKLPIPLIPIHILLINLFTDSFPALALAKESAEKNSMNEPPRPLKEGFLHGTFIKITTIGGSISLLTLLLFWHALESGVSLESAQTLAFVNLSCMELFVIFSLRSENFICSKEYCKNINIWIVYASLTGILVTVLLVTSPLSQVLSLESFPGIFWFYIFVSSALAVVIAELLKLYKKKYNFYKE